MNPQQRVEAYFQACGEGTAAEIAAHFTAGAVIYDTNVRPAVGADAIATMWVKVRERWQGARWSVDSFIGSADDAVAAIEWSMTGTNPADHQPFTFRGSEHYRFADDGRIAEIRQYWTFDPDRLNTALVGYDYTSQ